MSSPPQDLARAVDRLVDRYRVECLWFLREDYYPASDEERLRVLEYVERYGDREAWKAAEELRRWLSATSSAKSSGS